MIKFKLKAKEIKAIVSFLQTCIQIAKSEILNGIDIQVLKMGSGTMQKEVEWEKQDREKNVLRVAERNAHISEFEELQRKCLILIMRNKTGKYQTFSISKTMGYNWLIYMNRTEYFIKDNYINLIVNMQANIILKELI